MSRLSKDTVQSGNCQSNDSKLKEDRISVEYIICINDLGFGSIIHDSRTRAVTKKTNCHIEITPRILNKRVNLYRWIKYAIIKLSGPDEASLNQCLRLLEKNFPIFLQRKEYSRRANVTIFTDNLDYPDNVPGSTGPARSGSTMSTCQGLLIKSPFVSNEHRSSFQTPWKISKYEKSGRYFSSSLVENEFQPSLPRDYSTRNTASVSRMATRNDEMNKLKIDKNKLFGSMATLSDFATKQSSFDTGKLNNILLQNERLLASQPPGKDQMKMVKNQANEKFKLSYDQNMEIHKPVYESIKINASFSTSDMNNAEDRSESKLVVQYSNIGAIAKVPQEGVKISTAESNQTAALISERDSRSIRSISPMNNKNTTSIKLEYNNSDSNVSAIRGTSVNSNLKKEGRIATVVPTNMVGEHIAVDNSVCETLDGIPISPRIKNFDIKVSRHSNDAPLANYSWNSLDSLSDSISHSNPVTQNEDQTISMNKNQNKNISNMFDCRHQKRNSINSEVNLSYASSNSFTNVNGKLSNWDTPNNDNGIISVVNNNRANVSNRQTSITSTSSSIVIDTDSFNTVRVWKDIKDLEPQSSNVDDVSDYFLGGINASCHVVNYSSSLSVISSIDEEVTQHKTERRLNFQKLKNDKTCDIRSKLLEISTSVVSSGLINVSHIQIKEMKFESIKNSMIGRNEIPPVRVENVTCGEEQINIKQVSGVSKNVVLSHSSIETPNGCYVNGINRSTTKTKDLENHSVEIERDKDIVKSIFNRLKHPTENTLIIMFEGNDVFSTGQMSMVFKPSNSGDTTLSFDKNHYKLNGKNHFVFESRDYLITAQSRSGQAAKSEMTIHNPTQVDQTIPQKIII